MKTFYLASLVRVWPRGKKGTPHCPAMNPKRSVSEFMHLFHGAGRLQVQRHAVTDGVLSECKIDRVRL